MLNIVNIHGYLQILKKYVGTHISNSHMNMRRVRDKYLFNK